MSINLKDIDKVANRSFFNQISNSGATLLQTSWTTNVRELGFSPDFAIVRTIIYNTLSTADQQIYQLNSSLSDYQALGSFPGSNATVGASIAPIISNPQNIIKLEANRPLGSVSFNISSFATDGTNARASANDTMATAEESSIIIEIDFISLK